MKKRVLKIAIIGAAGSGKTTIAHRLVNGSYQEAQMTVGLDILTWLLDDDDEETMVQATIFDFGGQDYFRFFQDAFIKGCNTVMLVFDMTRPFTLNSLDEWLPIIEMISRENWLLVGNKIDGGIALKDTTIEEKADELDIPYVLTSAKTGENFSQVEFLVRNLLMLA